MNPHSLIGPFLYLVTPLIATSLLIHLATRSVSINRTVVRPDHFNRFVRGLAALVAFAAMAATGVGTWRATSGTFGDNAFDVTVPGNPARPIVEAIGRPLDMGPKKLIGTVIVARRVGSRYFPLHGESRVVEGQAAYLRPLEFDSVWKDYHYTVSIRTEDFYQKGGVLNSRGSGYIHVNGPGWSDNRSIVTLPIGTLITKAFQDVRGLDHSPASLVPVDGRENLYLLIHLALADRGDPLRETPALAWLATEPFPPASEISAPGYSRSRDGPDIAPGFRMFAYLGPATCLLVLAAAAGSLCFRRGWRGPAFAGLTVAMVLYAGAMDALVLQRRAGIAVDFSKPEMTRVMAALALGDTFFHKARAGEIFAAIARDPKAPASLRAAARAAAVTDF